MDTAQWPQQGRIVGVVKRPQKEQALLNCRRCNSTNTKFCYYNNYSLSQPRYFCKTCRRYWTEGGSLRNVPVGGGSRKNKRPSNSSSSINPTPPNSSPPTNLQPSDQHMNVSHGLNLSFGNPITSMSALDLLRSGISSRGLIMGPFGEAGSLFGAGFAGFQEMMRNEASIGGSSGGYGGRMEEEGDGRILFSFEDLKQGNVSNGDHHGGGGDPTLFWNGGGEGGGGGGGSW